VIELKGGREGKQGRKRGGKEEKWIQTGEMRRGKKEPGM
jgi:hypothetical protein